MAIFTGGLRGLIGERLAVTVTVGRGMAAFSVVGKPPTDALDLRTRVRAAIENSGLVFPGLQSISATIGGHPDTVTSTGTDLSLALALLQVASQIPDGDITAFGELGLDGRVRHVRGLLPMVRGIGGAIMVPASQAAEARAGTNAIVVGVATLAEACAFLRGELNIHSPPTRRGEPGVGPCMSEVRGQPIARRALEIAAAGGHNILMVGCPGSGRTMLARRLPGIMPTWTRDEQLESSCIASVAGLMPEGAALLTQRPFRAPHHSVSDVALTGSVGPTSRPGELSLAHNGVLLIDEMPEFRHPALDAVYRAALDKRAAAGKRGGGSVMMPADFRLVGSMNPCLCGYLGHPRQVCNCKPESIRAYVGRVVPYAGIFDLVVDVPPVSVEQLRDAPPGESSDVIRRRVESAQPFFTDIGPQFSFEAARFRDNAAPLYSARALTSIVCVAKTIAALDGSAVVTPTHVAEARSFQKTEIP